MAYYTTMGKLPGKRHIQFRRPDGALYSEEVFGTEGFVGPTSTMYHVHPPTQVIGWKTLYGTKVEYVEESVMRMRHAKTAALKPGGTLGVVDHRAKPGTDLETMKSSGYLTEQLVIDYATKAGFTLAQMVRTREVVAMLAAGLSLWRIALPIIGVAVACMRPLARFR